MLNRLKLSIGHKTLLDPNTVEGRAHIQQHLNASEMGNASRTASALDLVTLLEDRVREKHAERMPAFVASKWLAKMKRGSGSELGTMKKQHCMLGRTAFRDYMRLVKAKQPKIPAQQSGSVNPLTGLTLREEHLAEQNRGIWKTITTLLAADHICPDKDMAELGRILSHIFWRDSPKEWNDS